MEQKRLIIAIAISMLILVVFQQIQAPEPGTEPSKDRPAETVDKETTEHPDRAVAERELEETVTDEPIDYQVKKIITDNIILGVNSYNSGLSKVKIKDKDGQFINLVRSEDPKTSPLKLGNALNWQLTADRRDNSVTARYTTDKLNIIREYKIEDNLIKIDNFIENSGQSSKEINFNQGWYNGMETAEDLKKENYEDTRLFLKENSDVENDLTDKRVTGNLKWGGIMNRFFITVFLNLDQKFNSVITENAKKEGGGCAGPPEDVNYPEIEFLKTQTLEPGQEYSFNQEFYIGLKEYSTLRSFNEDLEKVLAFGIFGFLSRIFLGVLITFYGWVGNYGLAIIMMTFLLQIFIFPLTIKSFKSMNSMKKLQPKTQKIREKYKEDPQRMNEEMMHLYKKHSVNPVGGCFPLLLQMPIFISLFTMLRTAAELRFASFLWINDLAAADVLFKSVPLVSEIPVLGSAGPLPLLMGGAMFLQQRVTGGTSGPQKNLTYIMPVAFTFLFMRFPAGLVLYWLTNSLLTFIVQYTISKKTD